MKRLEFLISWRRWRRGDIVERDDGVAGVMLSRKICKEIPYESGGATEAAVAVPAGLEAAASRTAAGERFNRRRK